MKPLASPTPPEDTTPNKPGPATAPKQTPAPVKPADNDDSVAGEEDPGSADDVLRRGVNADKR